AANRNEHLKNIIIPALKKNKIVICDRYLDSSIAYQGYARELGEDIIKQINFLALKYLPQITFYLDLDPRISIQRLKDKRKDKIEYFDLETIHFHKKVRKGFLNLATLYPERIHKLDSNLSLKELETIIQIKIEQLLKIKI
ncbi:MAG: dTMP kinase, partial [Candidatus Phytoplasma stylosanthis]|nr:dTMP kinase [Candidatus Phytoplasma stylosanthis]